MNKPDITRAIDKLAAEMGWLLSCRDSVRIANKYPPVRADRDYDVATIRSYARAIRVLRAAQEPQQ
jgi:hypothetical protein